MLNIFVAYLWHQGLPLEKSYKPLTFALHQMKLKICVYLFNKHPPKAWIRRLSDWNCFRNLQENYSGLRNHKYYSKNWTLLQHLLDKQRGEFCFSKWGSPSGTLPYLTCQQKSQTLLWINAEYWRNLSRFSQRLPKTFTKDTQYNNQFIICKSVIMLNISYNKVKVLYCVNRSEPSLILYIPGIINSMLLIVQFQLIVTRYR